MKFEMIAILRGVQPNEVLDIASCLFDSGFDVVEVPLNSPNAIESVRLLSQQFPERLVGAGTVLNNAQVNEVAKVSSRLIVTPNFNKSVIDAAKNHGITVYSGVMTPTECFAALEAGADALKIFPGELIGPQGVKAIKAVLPTDVKLFPVGGVSLGTIESWAAVGVHGFGIGSSIYKPGDGVSEIQRKASELVKAVSSI